jgi:hypothetical protein
VRRKRSTTSSQCARSRASNSAVTPSPSKGRSSNFRHLLERHDLTKAIFVAVAEHLSAKGELLRGGTFVDATLIAASPSTKNKAGNRDPKMISSNKGNQWYFGMKAYVGVDSESGFVHTAGVTTGSVHDAKVMANLIREGDRAVYGDKGYASEKKKAATRPAFDAVEIGDVEMAEARTQGEQPRDNRLRPARPRRERRLDRRIVGPVTAARPDDETAAQIENRDEKHGRDLGEQWPAAPLGDSARTGDSYEPV